MYDKIPTNETNGYFINYYYIPNEPSGVQGVPQINAHRYKTCRIINILENNKTCLIPSLTNNIELHWYDIKVLYINFKAFEQTRFGLYKIIGGTNTLQRYSGWVQVSRQGWSHNTVIIKSPGPMCTCVRRRITLRFSDILYYRVKFLRHVYLECMYETSSVYCKQNIYPLLKQKQAYYLFICDISAHEWCVTCLLEKLIYAIWKTLKN